MHREGECAVLSSKNLRTIIDYTMITIGSLISAIGLGVFLVEANVVPGGVTGISMAINFLWDGISVGTWIMILNVPLFIWGVAELGNAFGLRTLYGFGSNAIFIDLFRGEFLRYGFLDNIFGPDALFHGWALQNTETVHYMLKNDFFFFMAVGTVLVGIGLGLIFKFKGTTAGTEIVCAILKKRFGFKPGMSMLAVDFVVIAAASVVLWFSPKSAIPVPVLAMYALASLFFQSIILDHVVYGFDYAKNVMIMSSRNKEIAQFIMDKLDRGVTAFYARGMYSNQDKEVLMTIVSPNDARELEPQIRKLDPNAFVILSNVHEVLGEGFRSREDVEIKFLKNVQKREAEEAAASAAHLAIQAEIAAQAADAAALKAREIADASGKDHCTAHDEAKDAEARAQAARSAATKAREHAIELETMASSIEECVTLDMEPLASSDKKKR